MIKYIIFLNSLDFSKSIILLEHMITCFTFLRVNICSFVVILSFPLALLGNQWTTTVTTEEGVVNFGGPLLDEEKPLVGKWKGENERGDEWEIFRRSNHIYTIMISWMEDGKKEIFRGHGLWSVRNNQYAYVEILDRDLETDEGWPVEVKYRIPNEEIMVVIEKLESATDEKVITSTEDSGDCVETKVDKFDQSWMTIFHTPDPLSEALIFDQIQLARIQDLKGIVDFFTNPAFSVGSKLAGKWETTDNDPESEVDWKSELIRRADGTDSYVYLEEGDDSEPVMTHGMWGIRNGKFYGVELISENEVFPFEETFLFSEKIVQSTPKKFVTQWVDTERKVLMILPMVVTVTDQRIKEFKSDILNKEFKENKYGLEYIRKKIK